MQQQQQKKRLLFRLCWNYEMCWFFGRATDETARLHHQWKWGQRYPKFTSFYGRAFWLTGDYIVFLWWPGLVTSAFIALRLLSQLRWTDNCRKCTHLGSSTSSRGQSANWADEIILWRISRGLPVFAVIVEQHKDQPPRVNHALKSQALAFIQNRK